ncbi:MAG TPA: hypothetical protein VKH19_02350 [Gemmatimonadaceae bacterium]|nr:hypothetical protein [Gemmatimonadaceae bacterium]
MNIRLLAHTLALLVAASACHRSTADIPSRPVSSQGAGFAGQIYEVRQSTIVADEEGTLQSPRRGEIWLSSSTEIVSRSGALVPLESLRRGLRIRVWFGSDFTETSTAVQGRANRIVVDY